MKSRRYYKQKIKKALDVRGSEKNYYPTQDSAVRWFHILNRSLFENKLKPLPITVRRLRGCMGMLNIDWDNRLTRAGKWDQSKLPFHNPTFRYDMILNYRYKTWRDFLETLAHEMVHQYQVEVIKDPYSNHNANFYAWREKFARYKLKLCL